MKRNRKNGRYGASDKDILEFGLLELGKGVEVLFRLRKRMLDVVSEPAEFAKALLECGLAIEDIQKAI